MEGCSAVSLVNRRDLWQDQTLGPSTAGIAGGVAGGVIGGLVGGGLGRFVVNQELGPVAQAAGRMAEADAAGLGEEVAKNPARIADLILLWRWWLGGPVVFVARPVGFRNPSRRQIGKSVIVRLIGLGFTLQ